MALSDAQALPVPSRAHTPWHPGSILKTAGHARRRPHARGPHANGPHARWSHARKDTPAGRTPGGRTPGGRTRSPEAPKRFELDWRLRAGGEREEVFAHAQPLVEAALSGSNACVLAYGQAGSSKTYTMIASAATPGSSRCMDLVWDTIEASAETEWLLTLTYVELYNDAFRDLLLDAPAVARGAADRARGSAPQAGAHADGRVRVRVRGSANPNPYPHPNPNPNHLTLTLA